VGIVNPNQEVIANRSFGNFKQIRGTVYEDRDNN
jgi:hypothetical protein